MGDVFVMSQKELDRLEIAQKVVEGRLSQKSAAAALNLSYRQTKRLIKEYRQYGKESLISKKRGKASNRTFLLALKSEVQALISKHYHDFGPTFASEKLQEEHSIIINKETLRQWMIEWGIWQQKRNKVAKIHQQRSRRLYFGELVQIDGSPHAWFEDRAEKCCLIVFTDDATSKILEMRFFPAETTLAYFECIRRYVKRYGRPIAFYSDRHSIFRVNKKNNLTGSGETNFERAMQELGIKIICANSPQAKGRVERANRTLQDRLVKEMRLKNISDIDSANRFLEAFRKQYNKKFGEKAACPEDKHRKNCPDDRILKFILSERYSRKLSKNLEFSFNRTTYQIVLSKGKIGYGLRNAQIAICRHPDNTMTVLHKENKLRYKKFSQAQAAAEIQSGKTVNHAVDRINRTINAPSMDHPWKRQSFLRRLAKQAQKVDAENIRQ